MMAIITDHRIVGSKVIKQILRQVHKSHAQAYQSKHGTLPCMYYDKEWPSVCEVGEPMADGQIQWQAQPFEQADNLDALAHALECQFPEQLNLFYSQFFAGNIVAQFDGHQIELLQPWNHEDYERLQQNITGHVLMKRKLKQADTVFIGLTEQDDLLITVKLSSGEVCLEYVGKEPHHVLASSIEELLEGLSY
ncbi:SecY-interacting protein [Pseudoalteromonas aurantia]|uniref:SecY-interacting protein n=1 Tax=Pseudoalteromonas aurantia TaxID=43654 RepID=A0ABY2W1L1_9GAMM|nr:SecY-interacting protein [Pseudoalteromonas aurantia]TMO64527.1 SecY-interacting protein [Pseudoalteromonas aurantia]TMO77674.1 SecY-interacting protein [Pseudoalteromonas aurantia]